ncbi:hypothetical protein MES4922_10263 [Mesorhizobium ventifaucium]|uniref:DUF982 domain-containing protein n=1 Tax=Mesorhizobium ventifaucium TaxID=666020 RepID=A0ABM9DCT9_9HYPH|nr:hypothetical protein MES4922_10263 [Mesorhizobium ventifaucium]
MTVGNLHLGASPSVHLDGKENKVRICPTMPTSLAHFVTNRGVRGYFLARTKELLTRFGNTPCRDAYAAMASKFLLSLARSVSARHDLSHGSRPPPVDVTDQRLAQSRIVRHHAADPEMKPTRWPRPQA